MSFKVIVIDDKPLIRESIVKTIDWENLDCEVIGEADNGIDGRNLIMDARPDIIITDIKMPGLNGLELSEYVKPFIPAAKIILITGYQEFELAQKAVKLGVYDLLLKPLSNEDICRVVKSAVNDLRNELAQRLEEEKLVEDKYRLEMELRESAGDLRKKFVLDLINGNVTGDAEQVGKISDKLELNCIRYLITVIRFKTFKVEEMKEFFNQTGQAVQKVELTFDIKIVDVAVDKSIVLFILFKNATSVRKSKGVVEELYKFLSGSLDSGLSRNYLVASSSLYNDFQQAKEAYDEVLRILDMNFFKTNEQLLYPSDNGYLKAFERFSIVDELQEFYSMLEYADKEELLKKLNVLIEKSHIYSKGDIYVAKGLLSEICITVTRHSCKHAENKTYLFKDVSEILSDINNLANIKEAAAYMNNYIANIRMSTDGNLENTNPIVKKTVEYIKKSFSEDISLESLGEKFGINSSYLSRLLKRETGRNFVDILAGVRIEAAKRLLKDPNSKVCEVAELVGYKDYTYFYQVFKRIEGISPNEYKKSVSL